MENTRWKFIGKPYRGHKFYREISTAKLAIADDSGRFPEDTEDGILWVDFTRKMELSNNGSVSIPVLVHRESDRQSHTSGDLTEAFFINSMFDMEIIFRSPNGDKFRVGGVQINRKEESGSEGAKKLEI